jgi:hypothetical protein
VESLSNVNERILRHVLRKPAGFIKLWEARLQEAPDRPVHFDQHLLECLSAPRLCLCDDGEQGRGEWRRRQFGEDSDWTRWTGELEP